MWNEKLETAFILTSIFWLVSIVNFDAQYYLQSQPVIHGCFETEPDFFRRIFTEHADIIFYVATVIWMLIVALLCIDRIKEHLTQVTDVRSRDTSTRKGYLLARRWNKCQQKCDSGISRWTMDH